MHIVALQKVQVIHSLKNVLAYKMKDKTQSNQNKHFV